MTQDEIIDMARQAGFVDYELDDGTTNAFDKRYKTFAKLVAEREREKCAKLCEEQYEYYGYDHVFAKGIRQRGEA